MLEVVVLYLGTGDQYLKKPLIQLYIFWEPEYLTLKSPWFYYAELTILDIKDA